MTRSELQQSKACNYLPSKIAIALLLHSAVSNINFGTSTVVFYVVVIRGFGFSSLSCCSM